MFETRELIYSAGLPAVAARTHTLTPKYDLRFAKLVLKGTKLPIDRLGGRVNNRKRYVMFICDAVLE